MVFDDNEMELTPPIPSGPYMDTTSMDQPAADFSDFHDDDFLNTLCTDGDLGALFESPSAEKTDFDFGWDPSKTSNKAAEVVETNKAATPILGHGNLTESPSSLFCSPSQELVGQSREGPSNPVEGHPLPVDAPFPLTLPQGTPHVNEATNKTSQAAPCVLTLPPSPAPAKEPTTDTNGKLSFPDSAQFCSTLPEDSAPVKETPNVISDQVTMPSQDFLDFNFEDPLVDVLSLADVVIPDTVSAAATSYIPQPVNAPAMASFGGTNLFTPQQVKPQNTVSMPPSCAAPYPIQAATQPSLQVPPVGVPNAFAPQSVAGHQQPAANLYAPYGAAPRGSVLTPMVPHNSDQLPAKKIRHRRDGNRRDSNNPSLWYQGPPFKPADWSPIPNPSAFNPAAPPPKRYKTPVFKYNDQGEWLGNVLYSRDELETFLTGPAGDGKAPSRREPLTLWIQSTPAYELHRYGPDASICRWNECPVKKNTISKGQFRVAFDERARLSGTITDPFRVAGYMHLFCFEECFELVSLMFARDRWNVAPDTRTLRFEERNPMALNAALVDVVNRWVRTQSEALQESMSKGEMQRVTPLHARLWHALTRAHTSVPGYLEQLEKRNDIHVGKYMGDLRLYQQMKDEKLMEQREAARVIVIEDDENEPVPETPAAMPVTKVPANQAEVGASQVTSPAPRRPSLTRYIPLAGCKRSRSDEDDAEVVASQVTRPAPRGPSITRYTPPASRKRTSSDECDVEVASRPTPAKRPRFDIRRVQAEVKAAVEETLKKQKPREVRCVSRVLTSMIPAVDAMPHYKRMEVESLVSREADRVRMGVVPRWGSTPGGLGMGARKRW